MPISNTTFTINTNTAMLFALAERYGTPSFTETFVKVYDRFRYRGATRLQWKALKNIFNDVFTEESKDAWRSILTTMQKTCISFPTAVSAVSFLWNGTIVADHGDYEGWVIEG